MEKYLSYEEITKDIMANRRFQIIATESHHGITRMEHSIRVAKNTYKISKKLNLDYVSATRAALLHDFFTVSEFGNTIKWLACGVVHPSIALSNASVEFELNEKEKNCIEAHMFPLSLTLPRYSEAWVITCVDKGVAIYEYLANKFSVKRIYKFTNNYASLAAIFIYYFLTSEMK